MGVRFECPAGHKLHVKTELAGKRGICPECGAKFIVPSFSGERVAEDNGATTNSTVAVNAPASPATISTATPPPLSQAPATPAPAAPEPTAWYIRPASGGQFGPASDEVFAQWIAEGRVSADAWVWRNGWADWKAGGEALRDYGARAPAGPALAMAAAAETSKVNVVGAGPTVVVAAPQANKTDAAAQVDATSAEVRRAEIKRRKKKVRNLSIMLGVVALAMLAALVVMLAR
jgi:hypothetical protein